jgi:hypothetical protein
LNHALMFNPWWHRFHPSFLWEPLVRWKLGFRQFSFHHEEQVLRRLSSDGSRHHRFSSMLLFPSLSTSGKLADLELSPELS